MSALPPLSYAGPQPPLPPHRMGCGPIGWVIFAVAVLAVFVLILALAFVPRKASGTGSTDLALSDFYQQLKAGNVASIDIDSDTIEGTFRRSVTRNGTTVLRFRTDLPQGTSGNWTFTQMVLDASPATLVRATASNNILTNFILPFIPWLLIMGFIWLIVVRSQRKNNASRTPMPVVVVNPEVR